jgi:hypothetical protein
MEFFKQIRSKFRIFKNFVYLNGFFAAVLFSTLVSCTADTTRKSVPLPGQSQLKQVYIFSEKADLPLKEWGAVMSLPSIQLLESHLNARLEYLMIDQSVGQDLIRNYYSRPTDLFVLMGPLARNLFLEASLPKIDAKKVLFVDSSEEVAKVLSADEANWFSVFVDVSSSQTFLNKFCSVARDFRCESLPKGLISLGPSDAKRLQVRLGRDASLDSLEFVTPHVNHYVAWEDLFVSILNSKPHSFASNLITVAHGSPYLKTEQGTGASKSDLEIYDAVEKRKALFQLEALRGAK